MHLVRTGRQVYSTGLVYSPQLHVLQRAAVDPCPTGDPGAGVSQFVRSCVVQKLITMSIGDKSSPMPSILTVKAPPTHSSLPKSLVL